MFMNTDRRASKSTLEFWNFVFRVVHVVARRGANRHREGLQRVDRKRFSFDAAPKNWTNDSYYL